MSAAANYAVCFGDQDPTQNVCVSLHKGRIFLADQTLYLSGTCRRGGFGGSSPYPFSKLFKSAPLRQIAMILWSIKRNAFEL